MSNGRTQKRAASTLRFDKQDVPTPRRPIVAPEVPEPTFLSPRWMESLELDDLVWVGAKRMKDAADLGFGKETARQAVVSLLDEIGDKELWEMLDTFMGKPQSRSRGWVTAEKTGDRTIERIAFMRSGNSIAVKMLGENTRVGTEVQKGDFIIFNTPNGIQLRVGHKWMSLGTEILIGVIDAMRKAQ